MGVDVLTIVSVAPLTNVAQVSGAITFVKTIADRMKAARDAKDWSQADLAREAGVSPGTIGNIESGIRDQPRQVVEIAGVLGVSPQWLLTGRGPREAGGVRSTPVLGVAKLGTNGWYDEQLGQDGWVDGFPSNDPDAYALRVKGDSMHPAIRNGMFVVVEPRSTPSPGEYVAVALKDGRKMVKELVISRPAEIVVESVNGGERLTIARAEIETCHLVAAIVTSTKWRP